MRTTAERLSARKASRKKWIDKNRAKYNAYHRDWRKRNSEKTKEIRRRSKNKRRALDQAYDRSTKLGTYIDGKKVYFFGVKKRPYPENNSCELCGECLPKKLAYHHWDDNDLKKGQVVKGLWLCWKCHMMITLREKHLDVFRLYRKYLVIKNLYGKQQRGTAVR